MASAGVPQRIVLSSTSKITLNSRFSKIKPPEASPVVSAETPRVMIPQQVSTKNKKLAFTMGNRLSVKAALQIRKKTLRQRLGLIPAAGNDFVAVRGTKAFPKSASSQPRGGITRAIAGPLAGRFMFTRGGPVGALRNRGRLQVRGGRGQLQIRGGRGQLQIRGGRGQLQVQGGRGQMQVQGGRGQLQVRGGRMRGQVRSTRMRGQAITKRGQGQVRTALFKGRGGTWKRGTDRGGKSNVSPLSRDRLDDELDAYMSRGKGGLDAELDLYMNSK